MEFNVDKKDYIRLKICILFYICTSIFRAKLSYAALIKNAVKNWYQLYFVYFGIKKSAIIEFNDGYKISIDKTNLSKVVILSEFYATLRKAKDFGIDIRLRGNAVIAKIKGKVLILDKETAPSIIAEAVYQQHGVFIVEGKDVLDVGAYIGDTPIYYYLFGKAKHVYAFEPIPYLYKKGLQVIKRNNLTKFISFFNEGVSGEKGATKIPENNTNFDKIEASSLAAKGRLIKIISLDNFVKKYNIHDAFLKVDCEGCEYDIFKKISKETLQRFIGIHIEYHYGYMDLIKRLKKEGFSIIYTKPVYIFKGIGKRPMISGDIVAFRRKSILNLSNINKMQNKVILQ